MSPQIVNIGSNQSFGYKTQYGETYERNTKCVVHFKVSIFVLYFVYFVHRGSVPVPPWWCLAQSSTSLTQRQTARAKEEITSHLESKGLKTFSQQRSSLSPIAR